MPALLSQSQKFMASGALVLSVLALLFAFATQATPCAHAASGSCSVGDLETFTSAITVNTDLNDADSIISGDTVTSLLYVDAGNDAVVLGASAPIGSELFYVNGAVNLDSGTIDGTVLGGAVPVTLQGLDLDTLVSGDIIYGSAPDTFSRLAKGLDGQVLALTAGIPSWIAGGGSETLAQTLALGAASGANDILMDATQKVAFDGAGATTYILEESDDDLHVAVGGDIFLQIDQDLNSIAYGVGSSPLGFLGHRFGGAFTSDGSADQAAVVKKTSQLIGAPGDTAILAGVQLEGGVTTQTASESIGDISQLRISEPAITDNLTGNITVAASLIVINAPTEGVSNFAIWMPSGALGVSDGAGSAGEQLTSGGSGGNVTWTAAASSRAVKQNVVEHSDTQDALNKFVAATVYDFKYKETVYETIFTIDENGDSQERRQVKAGERYQSTGDYAQTYVGIMADETPWAMHYDNTILDPISTFGYTVLAIQELESLVRDLEARIAVLEAK